MSETKKRKLLQALIEASLAIITVIAVLMAAMAIPQLLTGAVIGWALCLCKGTVYAKAVSIHEKIKDSFNEEDKDEGNE